MNAEPRPLTPHAAMDTVFIHELKLDIKVGIYAWERVAPQTIQFDIEIGLRKTPAQKISDTVDYAKVVARIDESLRDKHIALMEQLAEAALNARLSLVAGARALLVPALLLFACGGGGGGTAGGGVGRDTRGPLIVPPRGVQQAADDARGGERDGTQQVQGGTVADGAQSAAQGPREGVPGGDR